MAGARIRTTHVGSLPRPPELRELLLADNRGGGVDRALFEDVGRGAVMDAVRRQADVGIDIMSDGEMTKISYATYIAKRVSGLGISSKTGGALFRHRDLEDHPDFAEHRARTGSGPGSIRPPVCLGPVKYVNTAEAKRDIANLLAAMKQAADASCFMNAASPGVLAVFIANEHYASEDEYVAALADAMAVEYRLINDAGLTLQVDCPDLAMSRQLLHSAKSEPEFLRIAARNVEALNHALSGIPAEKVRLHICWGNYPGPHTYDLPVATIFPILAKANVGAFVFEAANPRHEHEWEDWARAPLRDDKVLIPGVIDSSTNFVEHPRLVAQRIQRFVDIVGAERVIAGTDCGFGTFAVQNPYVFPTVAWSKLRALREGADLASERLSAN